MKVEDFPHLIEVAKTRNRSLRFKDAIEILDRAVEEKAVRNVVLNDIKSILGTLVDDCWKANVQEPFFYAQRFRDLPEDVVKFDYTLNVSGLHSFLAVAKRLEKTTLEHPAVDAMRKIAFEILPLAETVRDLKPHIVMGKAPRTEPPKPENPNKVVRTCPCCFKHQAVQANRMVHHGYQRPGWGQQTSSCAGIRYKPLERSNEGLVAMIKGTEQFCERETEKLAHKEKIETVPVVDRNGRHKLIGRDHQNWDRIFANWVGNLEGEIRNARRTLIDLNKILDKWVQTEADPENKPEEFVALESVGMRP